MHANVFWECWNGKGPQWCVNLTPLTRFCDLLWSHIPSLKTCCKRKITIKSRNTSSLAQKKITIKSRNASSLERDWNFMKMPQSLPTYYKGFTLRRNLGIWGTKMSLSLRAFCGLGIFGIKFREILMKTTVQNNKNSGNFCIFFIQNSGNFYEKKQLLDVFFPRNSGNFCCAVRPLNCGLGWIPGFNKD